MASESGWSPRQKTGLRPNLPKTYTLGKFNNDERALFSSVRRTD